MERILSAAQMKACDNGTISKHDIPSLVLMERAAMSVASEIEERFEEDSLIGVVCGLGNNGGDGVAIARILFLDGYDVTVHLLGDESKYSDQLKQEISIARSYGLPFTDDINELEDSDVIVDAIFGIGLSRPVEGIFKDAIDFINGLDAYIVAVDIPSGYCADCGNLLGTGIIADLTVTFAYCKKGILLSDCYLNSGEVVVADAGIYVDEDLEGIHSYLLDDEDLILIPTRPRNANKGTCGKVLVIAGSDEIYGACYLSAKSAMVTGSGLVKIYTHRNNLASIQTALPEALSSSYEEYDEAQLADLLTWPDSIIIGPGLGTSNTSKAILSYVLKNATQPLVIDADAINILAADLDLLKTKKAQVILTPHLKEMERLCGIKVKDINLQMEKVSADFVNQYDCTLVLKNFVTLTTVSPSENYINNSGNEALATAGSGDVLSGIIGALLGMGLSAELAASLGVYIHGLSGEAASEALGVNGVLASDIIAHITEVM